MKASKLLTAKNIITRRPIVERLERSIYYGIDGCWYWTGTLRENHYGVLFVHINGKKRQSCALAHRLAYEIWVGEIPSVDLQVCHHCDNPMCINPNHLFLGTAQDNATDKKNKGRCTAMSGEANGARKLSVVDVRVIQDAYNTGQFSQSSIAKYFKIGQSQVGRLVRGVLWKNVPRASLFRNPERRRLTRLEKAKNKPENGENKS